ncbi:MAG: hypothetical protein B6D73_18705 [gamma proteobacterium symbiont of Stewartia floridana]|nr:MAG: hypothetical protein B6D73_18705 [gamma proteobacterium symbiont of Stewartia floridana]
MKNPPGSKQKKEYLYVDSRTHHFHDRPYKEVEVLFRFSEEDWKSLSDEASHLGYGVLGFLEKRLKKTIHYGAPKARIDHAANSRWHIDGYAKFWMPFLKYLITAHVTVIAVGYIVEHIVGSGKEYILFYWIYLFSLLLSFVSLLGFKLKWLLENTKEPLEGDWGIKIETIIAGMSERLIWTSLTIFGFSLLARIVLGVIHAAEYFEGLS